MIEHVSITARVMTESPESQSGGKWRLSPQTVFDLQEMLNQRSVFADLNSRVQVGKVTQTDYDGVDLYAEVDLVDTPKGFESIFDMWARSVPWLNMSFVIHDETRYEDVWVVERLQLTKVAIMPEYLHRSRKADNGSVDY